ncbi:MAG TPA: 4'-phosphopantetheinyl transferase superfamily protein [Polyangiaceae bacterium]|jgi:4'-phosphopantetheinyl transferase EntD|nr:4'-phosphopantetheinyl transferase superfamily protein [Polyangiaceae bacterium]
MTALETLFPDASYIAEAEARLVDEELLPEEWAFIQGAVPKRRAEFGTARVCARRGFAALGIPPAPIVPVEQGMPTWPRGVAGSISHASPQARANANANDQHAGGAYCAVVLYRSPPVRSVGLDVEIVQELEPGVLDLILTSNERAWLRAQGATLEASLPLVFFSAKEAYYKCQFPISRTFLDFVDVELEIFADALRFVAHARRPGLPREVVRLEGRYAFETGRLLSGVVLR